MLIRNSADRLLKMCRQPSSATLNVHGKEGEGEATDLGMVFKKGNHTSAFNCYALLHLFYCIHSFIWQSQNSMIPCRSQQPPPAVSIPDDFFPVLIQPSCIFVHLVLASNSWPSSWSFVMWSLPHKHLLRQSVIVFCVTI